MRTLTSLTAAAVLVASLGAGSASAEPGGCLKYGAAGAVGGHLAGHGVLGAVGGCAAGMYRRHLYRKNQAAEAAQQHQQQTAAPTQAQPYNGAYTNQPGNGANTYGGSTGGTPAFTSGSAFDNNR